MNQARQKDFSRGRSEEWTTKWKAAFLAIATLRIYEAKSAFTAFRTLGVLASTTVRSETDLRRVIHRSNKINTSQLDFGFNRFSKSECLTMFSFCKSDVGKVKNVNDWVIENIATSENCYAVTALLVTYGLLSVLATP